PANVLSSSLRTYATPNLKLPILHVYNIWHHFNVQDDDDQWLSTCIARFSTLICKISDRTSSVIAKAVKVDTMGAACTPQFNFVQCIRLLARLPVLQSICIFVHDFAIEDHGFMHDFNQLTSENAPCLGNLTRLELLLHD